jgi:hypothetical protein
MTMSDKNKASQPETTQEARIEDLPTEEATSDEVKGGGGLMSLLNTSAH